MVPAAPELVVRARWPSVVDSPDRLRAAQALVACVLAGAGVAAWSGELSALPVPTTSRVSVLIVVGCLWLCVRAQRLGICACSSVYLVTLAVFHFGVAVLLATDTSFERIRHDYDFRWLSAYPMSEVLVVATFGLTACATGVAATTCVAAFRRGQPGPVARTPVRTGQGVGVGVAPFGVPSVESRGADLRAPVGCVILSLSIAALFWVIGATDAGLLFGTYAEVGAQALSNPVVPYLRFGIGFGAVLAVAGGPGRWRVASIAVFAGFALIALPLGLRGEVMFPALAAVAVAARRRRVFIPAPVLTAGVLAVLALISGLREIRQQGLNGVDLGSVSFNPVNGLAELGASIRPVGAVLAWRDYEPAAAGATFLGPAVRLGGHLLGIPQTAAAADHRLFNVLILGREGPIGGSPVAEAYYNFGFSGVAGVMLVIGVVVAWLDVSRHPRAAGAGCLVLLVPLLIQVRNAFTAVPFQILFGLLLLAVIAAAEQLVSGPRRAATANSCFPSPGTPFRATWNTFGSGPVAGRRRLRRESRARSPSAPPTGIVRAAAPVSGWVILAAAANLGQAVLTARMLSVEGRGELVVTTTVAGMSSVLFGAGTNVAYRHFRGRGDPRVTFGHYFGFALAMMLPSCFTTVALTAVTLRVSSHGAVSGTVLVGATIVAGSSLLSIQLLDAMNAMGAVSQAAAVAASSSICQVVVLLGLSASTPGLAEVLAAVALGWVGQAIVCLVFLARAGTALRPRWSGSAWQLLLDKGVPSLGLGLGATAAFRVDRYLVAVFAGSSAAGIYSIAAAAGECLRLVPGAFGQLLFHRSAARTTTPEQVLTARRRITFAVAVAGGGLVCLAPWLVHTAFGSRYDAAVGPLRLLVAAEIVLTPCLIDCRVLSGLGRTAATGAVGIGGFVASTALYLALVPSHGAMGAAVASVLGYGAMTTFSSIAIRRVSRETATASDAPLSPPRVFPAGSSMPSAPIPGARRPAHRARAREKEHIHEVS